MLGQLPKLRPTIFVTSLRNYARKTVKKSQMEPGITTRRQLLDVNEIDDDFIDFDDFESDFSSVGVSHKEHVRQMETWQEKERYLLVRDKYFKEKLPNFLTWHDKQQIRYLHGQNPEEWTVDVLSEAFPALPDVIEKIVKGNWDKKPDKIANHDASVRENWDKFKRGELSDLPDHLQRHLQKFTNRALNFSPFKPTPSLTKNLVPNKTDKSAPSGEFSSIISSYKKIKDKNSDQFNPNTLALSKPVKKFDSDSHVTKNVSPYTRPVTLTDLQSKIAEKADSPDGVLTEEEKLILYNVKRKSGESVNNEQNKASGEEKNVQPIDLEEFKSVVKHRSDSNLTNSRNGETAVGFTKKDNYSHLMYPHFIKIPKELYRKGATYKLNDCYYDFDGRFLYRVPGMG